MMFFNLNHILNELFKIQFLNVWVETHILSSWIMIVHLQCLCPVRHHIEVLSRLLEQSPTKF